MEEEQITQSEYLIEASQIKNEENSEEEIIQKKRGRKGLFSHVKPFEGSSFLRKCTRVIFGNEEGDFIPSSLIAYYNQQLRESLEICQTSTKKLEDIIKKSQYNQSINKIYMSMLENSIDINQYTQIISSQDFMEIRLNKLKEKMLEDFEMPQLIKFFHKKEKRQQKMTAELNLNRQYVEKNINKKIISKQRIYNLYTQNQINKITELILQKQYKGYSEISLETGVKISSIKKIANRLLKGLTPRYPRQPIYSVNSFTQEQKNLMLQESILKEFATLNLVEKQKRYNSLFHLDVPYSVYRKFFQSQGFTYRSMTYKPLATETQKNKEQVIKSSFQILENFENCSDLIAIDESGLSEKCFSKYFQAPRGIDRKFEMKIHYKPETARFDAITNEYLQQLLDKGTLPYQPGQFYEHLDMIELAESSTIDLSRRIHVTRTNSTKQYINHLLVSQVYKEDFNDITTQTGCLYSCIVNNKKHQIFNGQTFEVVAFNKPNLALQQMHTDRLITYDLEQDFQLFQQHFEYGLARTIYKIQGITIREKFQIHDCSIMELNELYTSISRCVSIKDVLILDCDLSRMYTSHYTIQKKKRAINRFDEAVSPDLNQEAFSKIYKIILPPNAESDMNVYIIKTNRSLRQRMKEHKDQCHFLSDKFHVFLKGLSDSQIAALTIIQLQQVRSDQEQEVLDAEKYWIQKHIDDEWNVFNTQHGKSKKKDIRAQPEIILPQKKVRRPYITNTKQCVIVNYPEGEAMRRKFYRFGEGRSMTFEHAKELADTFLVSLQQNEFKKKQKNTMASVRAEQKEAIKKLREEQKAERKEYKAEIRARTRAEKNRVKVEAIPQKEAASASQPSQPQQAAKL